MTSNIKLDLKNFKHVKSDAHTTTLEHRSDKHTITLHHPALSPEAQAQLTALSKIASDSQTPVQADEKQAEGKQKFADGGDVQKPDAQYDATSLYSTDPQAAAPALQQRGDITDAHKQAVMQAFQMDPEAFQRAMQMAAGTMGSVSMAAPEAEAIAGAVAPEAAAAGKRLLGDAAVEAPSAAEGMQQLQGVHAPYGKTVNVVQPQPQGYGKVTGKPFAKGGEVDAEKPHFDDGGQVAVPDALSPVSTGFSVDPQAAAPILEQRVAEGNENAVKAERGELGLVNLLNTPGATGVATPKELDLEALTAVKNRQDADQINRATATVENSDADAQIAAKRAQLGLGPDINSAAQAGQQQADASQPAPGSLAPQSLAGKVEAQSGGIGMGGGDPAGVYQQGYQNSLQGIGQEAKAEGALGQSQAGILQQQIQGQQQAQQAYKDQYAGLEQERQAHMADIKAGHIDPEKYWDNHSKIASGIGMILAGFNPTNSPNAAVNFLKFQMEQNLQAQQKNLDSNQNLLAANLRQFGNLKDATDMSRIMQHDIVANQLNEAAATAKTPMAAAQAKEAAGKLQMEAAGQFQNFAMRRTMMNLANSPNGQSPQAVEQMLGYMRVANPEMAKEMESRYVPGVGLATIPIPAEARTQMIMRKNFDGLAQRYMQFANAHSGSMNPATTAEGKAMAAELQGAFRQASNGGVFKEGEQKFIEQLIPQDPTQFAASVRTNPKIREILASNQMQLNAQARGYGLPVHQAAQSQQNPNAALQWAQANPKDPRAAKILQTLGK